MSHRISPQQRRNNFKFVFPAVCTPEKHFSARIPRLSPTQPSEAAAEENEEQRNAMSFS